MIPRTVAYLPAAGRDLDDILDYLEVEAGKAVAERYVLSFRSSIARLSEFPFVGAARPELGPAIRHWVVDPYLVLYDVDDTSVSILRIIHGKRRITPDSLKTST